MKRGGVNTRHLDTMRAPTRGEEHLTPPNYLLVVRSCLPSRFILPVRFLLTARIISRFLPNPCIISVLFVALQLCSAVFSHCPIECLAARILPVSCHHLLTVSFCRSAVSRPNPKSSALEAIIAGESRSLDAAASLKDGRDANASAMEETFYASMSG